jgi:hypothetical protein
MGKKAAATCFFQGKQPQWPQNSSALFLQQTGTATDTFVQQQIQEQAQQAAK